MRSLTVPGRFVWQLAAVFQLLLPGFASLADGRAEAEATMSSAQSHLEAAGSTTCPRAHPADCAICRVIGTGATTTPVVAVYLAIARVIEVDPQEARGAPRFARSPGDPPQRAPPV